MSLSLFRQKCKLLQLCRMARSKFARRFSTAAIISGLQSPTDEDANEFLARMDNRDGSVVTSKDILEQYIRTGV